MPALIFKQNYIRTEKLEDKFLDRFYEITTFKIMELFKRFIEMLYNSYECEFPDMKNPADVVNRAAQGSNKVMLF